MGHPTRHFHIPSALRPSPSRIEPEEARELTRRGALLVDVRRQDDHTDALPGAVRIEPDKIPERAAGLSREVAIVLACT